MLYIVLLATIVCIPFMIMYIIHNCDKIYLLKKEKFKLEQLKQKELKQALDECLTDDWSKV